MNYQTRVNAVRKSMDIFLQDPDLQTIRISPELYEMIFCQPLDKVRAKIPIEVNALIPAHIVFLVWAEHEVPVDILAVADALLAPPNEIDFPHDEPTRTIPYEQIREWTEMIA